MASTSRSTNCNGWVAPTGRAHPTRSTWVGYVALLERIRDGDDTPVYAPRFDRHIEEPIANVIAVTHLHTTVITEGNYLLHDADGWERVRPLLDECRYVDCGDSERLRRLVARHVEYGRTVSEAAAWARDVDEPNARLIRSTMERADVIVRSDEVVHSVSGPQKVSDTSHSNTS